MANLGTLTVDLRANTAALEGGIKSAQGALAKFDAKLQALGAGMIFREVLKGFKMVVEQSEEAQKAVAEMGEAWDSVLKRFGPGAAMIAQGLTGVIGVLAKVIDGYKVLGGAVGWIAGGGKANDFVEAMAANLAAPEVMDFKGKAEAPTTGIDEELQKRFKKKKGMDFGNEGRGYNVLTDDVLNDDALNLLNGVQNTRKGRSYDQIKDDYATNRSTDAQANREAGRALELTSPEAVFNNTSFDRFDVAMNGAGAVAETVGQSLLGIGANLGDFGKVVGDIGSLIAETGGNPIAIIASVIARIAVHAKSFGKLMEVAGKVMETLGRILEPFIHALIPVIELINDLIPIFFVGFKPALEAMGKVMRVIVEAIAFVVNGVLEVLADIVGVFSDKLAKKIRSGKINLKDDTSASLDVAAGNTTSYIDDLGDAAAGATRSIEDYAAGLTNAPSGFKYALSSYNAVDGTNGAGTATPAAPIQVDTMNVNATSAKDILAQLIAMQRRATFQTTGTTVASAMSAAWEATTLPGGLL